MRFVFFLLLLTLVHSQAATRPNIIWIVGEDLGPELGCYGDSYARTPNLDKFAAQSARFTRAFTHAPVCAPARSGLITGQYPTKIGTHHMRSKLLAPPKLFTEHLRAAGYHVAWPGKTDFNFDVPTNAFDTTKPWIDNPPKQPFFGYINLGVTHESQIRAARPAFARNTAKLAAADRHDPARAPIPPYHPDTPEIRRDLANYYDLVTALDYQFGEIIAKLEAANLTTNSIIIFFGDHGRGLPRSKRWVYDSGIHVPLIVRIPGEKPAVREDLVSFIDFAPTVLSLAGLEPPKEMDGQIFLGPKRAKDRQYIYAARDRMDEAPDRIRAIREARYKYIKNLQPELPYSQRIAYMEEMPTTRIWREQHAAKKLNAVQSLWFAEKKPTEELYDTATDPHEVNNLATNPAHSSKLAELRSTLSEWIKSTGDLGAIPETNLIARGLVADKLSEYEIRKAPAK